VGVIVGVAVTASVRLGVRVGTAASRCGVGVGPSGPNVGVAKGLVSDVRVGARVGVAVGGRVGVAVGGCVGIRVGVALGSGIGDGVSVSVGETVAVALIVTVDVRAPADPAAGLCVDVATGEANSVGVGNRAARVLMGEGVTIIAGDLDLNGLRPNDNPIGSADDQIRHPTSQISARTSSVAPPFKINGTSATAGDI
jgi:hypothetical protein